MASNQDINAAIADVGPLTGDVEGILRRSDDEWLVRYPDLDVTLEFDEPSGRLVLTAELDEARPEARATVYATLLGYSLLWRDTGGVSIAMSDDRILVLMLTLYGPEVTPDLLTTILDNVVVKARALKTYIARGGEDAIATDTLTTTGIRV